MRRAGFALAAALALPGCASSLDPDISILASSSPQVIWQAGAEASEKKNWEAARKYFRRIIDGFPQSELAPGARLALADSHYDEGGTANNILAAAAYREFLNFYPSHPRADYAQHRVAESFYKQTNAADRDQTQTHQALAEFERLLQVYPATSHAEAARERVDELRERLGRAEFLVGYFYQKTRKAYRAAISRYRWLLDNYPDYSGIDEALFRLAECLMLTERPAEALPHLARLLESYPETRHAAEAQQLMSQIRGAETPPPEPAPTPTPTPLEGGAQLK